MTDQRLRELLDERVADVDARADLSAPAWARADLVRRRRRYAVVGAAAAVALVAAGTVAVLDRRPDADVSPSGRPTSTPSVAPGDTRAELAGRFRGVPFWWAPASELDGELPVLQVPGVPDVLSMTQAPYVAGVPDHVDAVFAPGHQRYVLLSDGDLTSVDLSEHLDEDGGSQYYATLGPESVSPDGTRIAFRQPGHVEIWDLPSDSWRTVPVADRQPVHWFLHGDLWTGDGPPPERPDPWTEDEQYSQVVVGSTGEAELDRTGDTPVPGAQEPGRDGFPEILAVRQDGFRSVLGISVDGRSEPCCAVVGWFSRDFVLFEASSESGRRVLAWRVGTPDLYRVSRLTDVPGELLFSSWAENAFTGVAR